MRQSPRFNRYPKDLAARDVADQFLWGPALMIAPLLDEVNYRLVYLPEQPFYDYYDGSLVANGTHAVNWNTEKIVPLYVRPGFIIPTQAPATTTAERLARRNSANLNDEYNLQTIAKMEKYFLNDRRVHIFTPTAVKMISPC